MASTRIFKFDATPARHRTNGAVLRDLVNQESCGAKIKTSTVTFPVGHAVEVHKHNCNEMVMVLAGDCAVEIDDSDPIRLQQFDTVHVAAGQWHRFLNLGITPFTILAIYDDAVVERSFRASGETIRD